MKRKTILLVEDDQDTADLLIYLFTTDGFKAVRAADGRFAFEYLSRHPVDVVLTDIMMPRMDGLQLVEAIRDTLGLKGLPILVHSALSENIARAAGKRFDAFVPKPCRGSDLLAHVRRVMETPLSQPQA
jgi:DNA-binding response OmpR family regulator